MSTTVDTIHRYMRYALIILCIGLFAKYLFHGCSDRVRLAPLTRHETFRVTIPAPAPVVDTVQGTVDTVWLVRTRTVEDSSRIRQILSERDSLACLLSDNGVHVVFTVDTVITHTHDTLHITCDETTRSIPFSLRYAPRSVLVDRTSEEVQIIEEKRSSLFEINDGPGIGGAVGLGIDTKGEVRLTLTVGLLYGVFFNEAPTLPRLLSR